MAAGSLGFVLFALGQGAAAPRTAAPGRRGGHPPRM